MSGKLTLSSVSKFLQGIGCKNSLGHFLKPTPALNDQIYECLIYLAKYILKLNPSEKDREIICDFVHLIDPRSHEEAITLLNQYLIVKPLFKELGINFEWATYLNADVDKVFDALEELVKYKLYKDQVCKEYGVDYLEERNKEMETSVVRMRAQRDESERFYLELQARKERELPKLLEVTHKKELVERKVQQLHESKRQLEERKMNTQAELDKSLLLEYQIMKEFEINQVRNQSLRKEIAVNGLEIQHSFHKAKSDVKMVEDQIDSEYKQMEEKIQRTDDVLGELRGNLREYYKELEHYVGTQTVIHNLHHSIQSLTQQAQQFTMRNQSTANEIHNHHDQLRILTENQLKLNQEMNTVREKVKMSKRAKQQHVRNQESLDNYMRNLKNLEISSDESYIEIIAQFKEFTISHKDRMDSLREKTTQHIEYKEDLLLTTMDKFSCLQVENLRETKHLSVAEKAQVQEKNQVLEMIVQKGRPFHIYPKPSYDNRHFIKKFHEERSLHRNVIRNSLLGRAKQIDGSEIESINPSNQNQNINLYNSQKEPGEKDSLPAQPVRSNIGSPVSVQVTHRSHSQQEPRERGQRERSIEERSNRVNLFGFQKTGKGKIPSFVTQIFSKSFLSKLEDKGK